MKNIKINYLKNVFVLALLSIANLSCERNMSDDAKLATFSKNGDVFIDTFSAGLGYGAFGGSNYTAFTVDTDVKYQGSASMRFDVPSVGDPRGAYAGGVFIDGSGRNLTDYDALTFWVKGSQAATINEFGLGTDFGLNKYKVTMQNVPIDTNWKKIIIPMPDASKLIQEKGMFWYSEGAENNLGYTFWIDNVKYEKLGTIAHNQPKIMDGLNSTQQAYIGTSINLTGLTDTFNMPNGINQTISIAPSYFSYTSSNPSIASVSDSGVITVLSSGTALITATLSGTNAVGSLTINSLGAFIPATTPTRPSSNVISLFSDSYPNVPVDFFNGYWGGQTTLTSLFSINVNNNVDNIQSYTSLNYVGIQTQNPPINASTMGFLHLDILPRTAATTNFTIKIRDRGSNGVIDSDNNGNATVDDKEISYLIPANQLSVGIWKSIDIPLTGNILNQKNNLALIVFIGNNNFFLDNLYYYKN